MMPVKRFDWVWMTLVTFFADRISKAVVESYPVGYLHTVVPGFFTFVHAANPGIAFGILADEPNRWVTVVLAIATVGVCALLIWLLLSGHVQKMIARVGLALILGGALGNLYDRVLHASVTDFLYFHLGEHYWPAFNVADSVIAIGTVLVGIDLVFLSIHSET